MNPSIICFRNTDQVNKFVQKFSNEIDGNNNIIAVVDLHSDDSQNYIKNLQETIEKLKILAEKGIEVKLIFNSCYYTQEAQEILKDSTIDVTLLGHNQDTVLPLELFLSFFQNKVPTSDQSSQLLKPASEEEEKELNDLLETYKSLKLVAYQSCSTTTTNDLLIDSKHALLAIAYAEHNPENKQKFLQVAKKILNTAEDTIKNHLKELQALLKENPVEGGETDHLNLFTILKEHQNNAVILKKVLECASAIANEKGERYFWRKAIEIVDYNVFSLLLEEDKSEFLQNSDNLSDLIRYALSNRTNQQEEIVNAILHKAKHETEKVGNNAINNLQEQHKKQKLNQYLQNYRNNYADNTSKSCIDWLPLQFLLDSAKEWWENLPSSICCCCTAKKVEEDQLYIGELGDNGL